jgi:hypothetical protein
MLGDTMQRSFLITMAVLICTTLPVYSQSPARQMAQRPIETGGIHDPASFTQMHAAIVKGLASSWSSSRVCRGSYPLVKFMVADDGKIYDPELVCYSADNQYDAECLEAICSLSPFAPIEDFESRIEHFTQEFGASEGLQPTYDGSDINVYLRTHLQPKDPFDAFVVVHKIPLTVLERYPGMFTKGELQSQNNLIEIPVGYGDNKANNQGRKIAPHYVSVIANLYAFWGQLFRNQNVTKEEIMQWANRAQKHTN